MKRIFLLMVGALACGPVFAKGAKGVAQGKKVYLTNCVLCHGEKGDGNGPAAAAIKENKPRNFTEGNFKYGNSPDDLFKTITQGVSGTAMPSWKFLSEKDRKAVVQYILSLKKK